MQLKKHTLWGVLLSLIPSFFCAQSVEHFVQKIPTDQGRPLGISRYTSVLSIEKNTNGLYVLTKRGGCYLLDQRAKSELKPLALPNDRKDHFFGLVSNQEKTFLWANGYELLPLNSEKDSRLPYSTTFFSKTVQANNIAVDVDGTIYVGTLSDGLFIFSKDEWGGYSNVPKRVSTFGKELPSNTIQCLYRDSENRIWVGTSAGLATITNGKIQNLSKREILPQKWWQKFLGIERERPVFSESVFAITSWRDTMYFATEDDLYKSSHEGDSLGYLIQYNLSDRLKDPLSDIKDLLVDNDGNFWIAANQLLFYNNTADKLSVISDIHTFKGEGFLSLAEDVEEEKIWVGTNKGGLYKLNYSNFTYGIGF